MRLLLSLMLVVLFLVGCSRLPFCSRVPKGLVVKRTSEKVEVDCKAGEGNRPRDGCVTKELSCGDQITGNTAGIKSNYDDDFYRTKYCLPFPHGYSGPDRVYKLVVPTNTIADVWLDSDCEDLDLFAFRWKYEGKCPTTSHLITECEADDQKKGGHLRLVSTTRETEYLIIVDGKHGVSAPFGLTVDCQAGHL